MRRKNKSAERAQHSSPQPLGVEQIARQVNMVNRLDTLLLTRLKSPSDSLEPVGPLAGKHSADRLAQVRINR